MLSRQRITFIGAGAMAEAIISGLLADNRVSGEQITVVNKNNDERLDHLEKNYGIKTSKDKKRAVADSDLLILAMKPKDVDEALESIQPHIREHHVIFSVLAGTTTDDIARLVDVDCPVVRVMANTSAKVAASASAISGGRHASAKDIDLAAELFSAIGTITVVPEEKMNSVTGVSGSGPAYFYYLLEGLQTAAVEAGLSEEESKALLIQTMEGAAKRWSQSSESLRSLYEEVMSPGGTTEAAFSVLQKHTVQEHLTTGTKAAIDRSISLGQPKKQV
ncbi:pyrroline-5-carboxylate reductase [Natribacillus halophilus]|uniref:Pyrroline-5-carboxylate reductase n=1 Tax=Natribacillus halophilus TaxID=549003 RepID=A0A1G8MDK9_9BACI|nr:pyrroline-5-carboxylate reductase [Natribacillus halophilus]SDI65955.1 pyrroline-5-carboxylate reductase [Natribacillus halophilus]